MKIKYDCYSISETEHSTWEGSIVPLKLTDPYELEVSARGSLFHLVVGTHNFGKYICIPNWNIGTELASLSDRFWNYERLTAYTDLSEADACSVVYALIELSKMI